MRNGTFSASTTTRPASNGLSRHASAYPSSSSVRPGQRPPSAQHDYRPRTAVGHVRSASQLKPSSSRPASVTDTRDTGRNNPKLGSRKGTPLLVFISQHNDDLRVQRKRDRSRNCFSHIPEKSLALQFHQQFSGQDMSSPASLKLDQDSLLHVSFQSMSLRSDNVQQDSFLDHAEEPQVPQTPSFIPRPVSQSPITSFKSQSQSLESSTPWRSHKRSACSSPVKEVFLTKDSNMKVPAWDTAGRLEDMESLYGQLSTQLEEARSERNGLEEGLGFYKIRGK